MGLVHNYNTSSNFYNVYTNSTNTESYITFWPPSMAPSQRDVPVVPVVPLPETDREWLERRVAEICWLPA